MAAKILVLRGPTMATFLGALLFIATAQNVCSQSDLELITSRDSRVYNGYEILDPEQKYVLEWTVNWPERRINFNVTVRTKGYVGFGLTTNGTMRGADIVMGGVRSDGSIYFSVSDNHSYLSKYRLSD